MAPSLSLNDLFGVQNKVVVITGGGRGIGKMMADGFVQNGAKVYIASRDLKACADTAAELNAKGPGSCIAIQADLSSEVGNKALAAEIATRESRVDVLINNSGAAWGGDLDNHHEKSWERVLSINVKAPFFLTVALLPLLDEAAKSSSDKSARVINIGSTAGLRPQPIWTIAYDTSKAAVHHLTRILAAKLARRPHGGHILVNAIAPGIVPSKMSKGITFALQSSFSGLSKFLPLERCGEPQDMAALAIFLASKGSSWITGEVIATDGGQVFATETSLGSAKL